MEKCLFGRAQIQIPSIMTENLDIFLEVVSAQTWQRALHDGHRQNLMALLPSFGNQDAQEKIRTLQKLFRGENFKFGNPLVEFHKKLRDGRFSPDVARYASITKKTKYREYKQRQKLYMSSLLKELVVNRQRMIDAVASCPPGMKVKVEWWRYPGESSKSKKSLELSACRKYRSVIQQLNSDCHGADTSSEEEDLLTEYERDLQYQSCLMFHDDDFTPSVVGTHDVKPAARDLLNNGGSRIVGRGRGKRSLSPVLMNEARYQQLMTRHKKRKVTTPNAPELRTAGITLSDVMVRTYMPRSAVTESSGGRTKSKSVLQRTTMTPPPPPSLPPTALMWDSDSVGGDNDQLMIDVGGGDVTAAAAVQDEAPTKYKRMTSAQGYANKPQYYGPHASFFCVLRDLICQEPDCKITTYKIELKVVDWQKSSCALQNPWIAAQPGWSDVTTSALKFLAGNFVGLELDNFVPFVNHRERTQLWQWIGGGRDGDDQLATLDAHWLSLLAAAAEASGGAVMGRESADTPPPRSVTDYVITSPDDEDIDVFREQESMRFENPHVAFTYYMHGYESVVAPVKGMYQRPDLDAITQGRARDHAILVKERPSYVSILTLVRDAVARLPNGCGTRLDVVELLKYSQFVAPRATDTTIGGVVSGALDRLHAESDPCVKYSAARKLWIYLHRNRSEQDFNAIHEAAGKMAKAKQALGKPTKVKGIAVMKKTLSRDNMLLTSLVGGAAANTPVTSLQTQDSSMPTSEHISSTVAPYAKPHTHHPTSLSFPQQQHVTLRHVMSRTLSSSSSTSSEVTDVSGAGFPSAQLVVDGGGAGEKVKVKQLRNTGSVMHKQSQRRVQQLTPAALLRNTSAGALAAPASSAVMTSSHAGAVGGVTIVGGGGGAGKSLLATHLISSAPANVLSMAPPVSRSTPQATTSKAVRHVVTSTDGTTLMMMQTSDSGGSLLRAAAAPRSPAAAVQETVVYMPSSRQSSIAAVTSSKPASTSPAFSLLQSSPVSRLLQAPQPDVGKTQKVKVKPNLLTQQVKVKAVQGGTRQVVIGGVNPRLNTLGSGQSVMPASTATVVRQVATLPQQSTPVSSAAELTQPSLARLISGGGVTSGGGGVQLITLPGGQRAVVSATPTSGGDAGAATSIVRQQVIGPVGAARVQATTPASGKQQQRVLQRVVTPSTPTTTTVVSMTSASQSVAVPAGSSLIMTSPQPTSAVHGSQLLQIPSGQAVGGGARGVIGPRSTIVIGGKPMTVVNAGGGAAAGGAAQSKTSAAGNSVMASSAQQQPQQKQQHVVVGSRGGRQVQMQVAAAGGGAAGGGGGGGKMMQLIGGKLVHVTAASTPPTSSGLNKTLTSGMTTLVTPESQQQLRVASSSSSPSSLLIPMTRAKTPVVAGQVNKAGASAGAQTLNLSPAVINRLIQSGQLQTQQPQQQQQQQQASRSGPPAAAGAVLVTSTQQQQQQSRQQPTIVLGGQAAAAAPVAAESRVVLTSTGQARHVRPAATASATGSTLMVRAAGAGPRLRQVTSQQPQTATAVTPQVGRAQPMLARLITTPGGGQGGAIRLVRAASTPATTLTVGQGQGQVRTVTGAQLRALNASAVTATSQGQQQLRTAVIQQPVQGQTTPRLRGVNVVQTLRLPVTSSSNL